MVNQKRLKEVLHYDAITGHFTWLVQVGDAIPAGTRAGYKMRDTGYIHIRFEGKNYYAHRLAFLYMKGYIPELVDHIDRIRHNNPWSNLREATHKLNSQNVSLKSNNRSGITGVRRKHNKWIAEIDRKTLISSPDFFEACCARKSAENKRFTDG